MKEPGIGYTLLMFVCLMLGLHMGGCDLPDRMARSLGDLGRSVVLGYHGR